MADNYRRAAVLAGQLADELVDEACAAGVELPRGLVGEEELRPVRERRADRDPLLLPSRELRGQRAPPVRETDALEELVRPAKPLRARRAGQAGWTPTSSRAVRSGSRERE